MAINIFIPPNVGWAITFKRLQLIACTFESRFLFNLLEISGNYGNV